MDLCDLKATYITWTYVALKPHLYNLDLCLHHALRCIAAFIFG